MGRVLQAVLDEETVEERHDTEIDKTWASFQAALTTGDPKKIVAADPDGRLSYAKGWQGWSLDPARAVLCAPCDLTYEVSLEDCTPTHKLRDTIFHIANKGDHYKVQGLLRSLGAVMGWTKTIKKGRWSASEGEWAAAKFVKNPHRCSTA